MLSLMTGAELRVALDSAEKAGDDGWADKINDAIWALEIDFAECDEFADYEGIDDSDDFDDFID